LFLRQIDYENKQKSWIETTSIILVLIFGLSYYILLLSFFSHYVGKAGILMTKLYENNKKVFVVVSTLVFFGIMFPILSQPLGSEKVFEIYCYVILAGIVTYVVTWLAKEKDSTTKDKIKKVK